MRVSRGVAGLLILVLLLSGLPLSFQPSGALAADTTIIVTMSSATKVFDLGPRFGYPSYGWTNPNLDVSIWDHAAPVSGHTTECIHQTAGSLGNLPLYWGPNQANYYYVRISFSVPTASSYSGSSIAFATYDAGHSMVLTDSNDIVAQINDSAQKSLAMISIDSLLKPGINVLGLFEYPFGAGYGTDAAGCGSGIGVRIFIHAQGVKSASPTSKSANSSGPAVALSFPANNAIVTGTNLPLAWNPFPHASAYLVHVWLVKADPGQAVTASTVANASLTVFDTRAKVSTARMLKGVYDWNVAAVDAKGMLIAGWGTPRNVQLE